MKVIFVKDLRGQGKRGDIKEVKDGYAQNYLIKNGYANRLTDQNYQSYLDDKEKEKELDEKKRKEANEIKKTLEKVELVFKVKTGKMDKVFGSVTSKQIKDDLEKLGIFVDKKVIDAKDGLSTLGYHDVKVELYKDICGVIKVKLEK